MQVSVQLHDQTAITLGKGLPLQNAYESGCDTEPIWTRETKGDIRVSARNLTLPIREIYYYLFIIIFFHILFSLLFLFVLSFDTI
jgi:hypothetical protein